MKFPNFFLERKALEKTEIIIAIDEAGRGAVAGPLTVSSILLPNLFLSNEYFLQNIGVNDSKKLSENKRETLRNELEFNIKKYIVHISNKEIDNLGIRESFYSALEKIESFWLSNLSQKTISLFIDFFPYRPNSKKIKVFPIKKGDERCLSISIASIFAKTERDRLMRKLHNKLPLYNFKKNKGYGTKDHFKRIIKYGISKYHRKKFLKKLKASILNS